MNVHSFWKWIFMPRSRSNLFRYGGMEDSRFGKIRAKTSIFEIIIASSWLPIIIALLNVTNIKSKPFFYWKKRDQFTSVKYRRENTIFINRFSINFYLPTNLTKTFLALSKILAIVFRIQTHAKIELTPQPPRREIIIISLQHRKSIPSCMSNVCQSIKQVWRSFISAGGGGTKPFFNF